MIGALSPKLALLVKFSPISRHRLRVFPCFVDTARPTLGSQFGAYFADWFVCVIGVALSGKDLAVNHYDRNNRPFHAMTPQIGRRRKSRRSWE